MTRLLLLATLLAGLPAQAALPLEAALDQVEPEAGADKDVALIVAIEDYDKAPDIPGARANARLWRQWFRARGTREVRVIEDGDATHGWDRYGKPQGLLPKIDTAAAQARRKGGTLWFVFIGHGAPVNERGVNQGVLLAHGVQQTAQSLRTHGIVVDGDLMPRLAKAGKSVAVLDACFSGRSSEGALVPGLQPLIPAAFSVSKAVTVFTAAKGTEFAGPLPDADRPAFSYLMLGALAGWADGEVDRKRDRQVTSEEAFEWVKLQMARVIHGRRQTPTMRGRRRTLSRAWASSTALGMTKKSSSWRHGTPREIVGRLIATDARSSQRAKSPIPQAPRAPGDGAIQRANEKRWIPKAARPVVEVRSNNRDGGKSRTASIWLYGSAAVFAVAAGASFGMAHYYDSEADEAYSRYQDADDDSLENQIRQDQSSAGNYELASAGLLAGAIACAAVGWWLGEVEW